MGQENEHVDKHVDEYDPVLVPADLDTDQRRQGLLATGSTAAYANDDGHHDHVNNDGHHDHADAS